MALKMLD